MERVRARETFELRHRVLRRGTTPAGVGAPDDDQPDSAHFVVRESGRVVATGTVRRRRPPPPDSADGWQVRGMAVEPEMRNKGYGSRILSAVLDHVGGHGGGLIWCHARLGALSLYRRAGLEPVGEPFEDEVAGLQVLMIGRVENR
ncbi:MAG TPA: GNAT family N-acetyltransferase [Actinomycetota bacterium]|nr:GNAT family N-acetyltransferase [Actinomycetota bacterium]